MTRAPIRRNIMLSIFAGLVLTACFQPFCLPADVSCSVWAALMYRSPQSSGSSVIPVSWLTFGGGVGNEAETLLLQTGDNGYVLAGTSTANFGSPIVAHSGGGLDIALIKLDSNGNQVWNTFAGGSGTDSAFGIAIANNGDILIAGQSSATFGSPLNSFGGVAQEALIMRYNSQGNLLWMTFFGYASDNDSARAIVQATDGNILIAGTSAGNFGSPVNAFSGGVTTDFLVAKFHSAGSLIWHTFLGGGATTQDAYAIANAASGDLYVSGVTNADFGAPINPYVGSQELVFARFNSTGNLLWHTFAGGGGNDFPYGRTATTQDDGYVMSGLSNASWGSPVSAFTAGDDMVILKFNANGSLAFNTFHGSTGIDHAYGAVPRADGTFCVVGTSAMTWGSPLQAHNGNNEITGIALAANGSLLWNSFYGSTGPDNGLSLTATTDGGCALGGQAGNAFGQPVTTFAGGDDFAVIKLFADGTL